MNRPQIVQISCIKTKRNISIYASISQGAEKSSKSSIRTPMQSLGLFRSNEFKVKVIALNKEQVVLYNKEFYTDNLGNLEIKIALDQNRGEVEIIQLYETSVEVGLDFLLGTYIPYLINSPKHIIISDFDKTLVDTKYSTPKELYQSLSNAINFFPTVNKSLDLFKGFTESGHHPFILSASPHFYQNAIRDWLYQQKIFTGNIFLKDYRKFISLTDGILTTKDFKQQGFYKLEQLINILNICDAPENIVLMGDGFESDTLIYLALYAIIVDKRDPWAVWNQIKQDKSFQFTQRQNGQLLSKIYQLGSMYKDKVSSIQIHIRSKPELIDAHIARHYDCTFIDSNAKKVNFYSA